MVVYNEYEYAVQFRELGRFGRRGAKRCVSFYVVRAVTRPGARFVSTVLLSCVSTL